MQGSDGESTATLALSRPAQRCLHVFPSSPRHAAASPRRLRAVRRCEPWAVCSLGLFGASCLAAVRRLALTSLADSAAHRAVACADRGARQPALGVPVKIGAIEVRSSGWVPALELRDVGLLDAEQRVALQPAARRRGAVAALAAGARAALRAAADRRRRARHRGATPPAASSSPGSTSAAGPGADDGATPPTGSSSSDEFVIRGGTVRWIDEQRAGAAAGADATSTWSCATACAATPSASMPRRRPAWGDRFTLPRPLHAAAARPRRRLAALERQHVHADLPRADVRELRRHVDAAVRAERGRRRAARLVRGAGRRAATRPPSTSRCARSRCASHRRRAARASSRSRAASMPRRKGDGVAVDGCATSASSPATASAGRRAT